MWPLLSDHTLYAFTGGEPPTYAELAERYARQARGRSPDGGERWLNWIVRRRQDKAVIGFVQATVRAGTAELAWTIAAPFQGRGYATEAAAAMARHLTEHEGIPRHTAHIHPGHAASQAVARSLGLVATEHRRADGETLWVTAPPAPP